MLMTKTGLTVVAYKYEYRRLEGRHGRGRMKQETHHTQNNAEF